MFFVCFSKPPNLMLPQLFKLGIIYLIICGALPYFPYNFFPPQKLNSLKNL